MWRILRVGRKRRGDMWTGRDRDLCDSCCDDDHEGLILALSYVRDFLVGNSERHGVKDGWVEDRPHFVIDN
jgi:hypothetical protein